jgi:formylglycine-generating enzyme required for sulfatase activity
MKRAYLTISITLAFITSCSAVFANSAPVVSNVTATQRSDDSKLVDIYYDLADTDGDNCTVWVTISDNGGVTWTVPAMTFTGNVGSGVTPGSGKQIIWDAGKDMRGKVSNYKARVFADDGHGPSDMVLVAAGYFSYQNTTPQIYLPGFFIDKYEVTNARYCEFLNNADPTGQYYSTNMEITKSGSYYIVNSGRENYPIQYVSYDDATAFASWCSTTYGGNYRLPTEQEWEKAAGWDPVLQDMFTYGYHQNVISQYWCNYNNYYSGPLPVGSFNGTPPKNDAKSYYGCYDMSGNLFEWTSGLMTCYQGNCYYYVRGGSFADNETSCLTSTTGGYCVNNGRYSYFGFRLVWNVQ